MDIQWHVISCPTCKDWTNRNRVDYGGCPVCADKRLVKINLDEVREYKP